MIVLRLKITYFLFVLSLSVYAQEPAYKNYTTSDGLTSNSVYSVMQDSHGFIWFATDNGVSRFDGTRFKNYTLSDGLSDNSVLRIAEDAEGRLWFLTFNGKLSFYQNGKIYNSKNCELLRKINSNSYTTYFYQDPQKNIWICFGNFHHVRISPSGNIKTFKTSFKVLLMWQDKHGHTAGLTSVEKFIVKDTSLEFNPPIFSCVEAMFISTDSIIIMNDHSVLFILNASGKIKKIENIPNYKTANTLGMSIDSKKNIWFCTLKGAIEYENGVISPEYEHDYLKNYPITSVFRDRNNNLWLTSNGNGVFMIPSLDIKLFDERSGLVDNNISAVEVLNDSVLIVGTINGSIQLIKNDVVKPYGQSCITTPLRTIIAIKKYTNSTAWIMAEKGLFKYHNNKFASIKDTLGWNKSLLIDDDGIPWIGWGAGLRKTMKNSVVNDYNYLVPNRIYAMLQLHNNDFLLGTDNGLYRFKDGKMSPTSHNNSLLTHRINAMAYTSDSTLWIATDDHGLLSYYNGIVTSYTSKDHMLSDRCNDLFIDSNKIYVATNNGLNVIYNENNTIRIVSYSVANGLVSNHINQVKKKGNNTIILATDRGLVEFDDRKLPLLPASVPYINSLFVNDSAQIVLPNYTFTHNENNIRIDFSAINFNSGGNIYYRYKLIGADTKWNYTTYTSVKYSYLHPGNYTFIVATQNADGSWNPTTASLSFYIQTPWWQTWWFRSLAGLILVGFTALIIKWRITVYKEKINREKDLAKSELKALRAQINPHFIYNSLNAIQDFILQNQKEDANFYLSKFATLMRSILSHSRASTVSLEEEIASLQLYLELEALRFNNHFSFQFIIDEHIDTEYVQIPSMILQPYIENAILHGLAPLPGGGKITISFCLENKFLVCTIEDNGIGRKKATEARRQRVWKEHKSLGMTVTQERIDLLSSHQKQKINLEITDLVDDNNNATGTKVTIYFPLID